MNEQKSYKQIVKATSLLGGVQVVNIIVGIIRSKFVAVLLGTTGMGILGLFTTTLSLIQITTGLGLSSSAVRDIAEANGSGDSHRIAKTITMFRRWVWVTGFSGTIITISLAPMLSKWTFGTQEYTWSFIWLSVICLLSAISSGQTALLQGMRRLKQMAKSTLFGSILGLFTSVPLYYLYGLKGIVPTLIITALFSLLFSWYFTRHIPIQPIKQTWNDTYYSGLTMAKLGLVLMLNGFMVTFVSYVVTLFINNKGGTSDVGLYRAGWTIATQYTGLVFTAMATDYYPRLAAFNKDNEKMNVLVNQQAEMGIIILTPLLIVLIGFIPIITHLLYSEEFIPIASMIRWSMVGMVFQMTALTMGFAIIAKGDKKIFLMTETIASVVTLLCNLVGYYYWRIEGIGIAFLVVYFVYCIMIIIISKKRYNVVLMASYVKLFSIEFFFISSSFIISYLLEKSLLQYCIAAIFVVLSSLFSLYELNKRLNLKTVILNKIIKSN